MKEKLKSFFKGTWYFIVSAFVICVVPVLLGAVIAAIVSLFTYGWGLIW